MKPAPNAHMQIVESVSDSDLIPIVNVDDASNPVPRYMLAQSMGAPASVETTPPVVPTGGEENLSGTGDLGPVSLTASLTNVTTTGAATSTLGPGNQKGLTKKKRMVADAGDCVISVSGDGISSITLTDVGNYCEVMWNGTGWVVVDNDGCTIV